MRPNFEWRLGTRSLQLGRRTLLMGVLNVTPDSFSDGGRYFQTDRAVEQALQMLADGADIIDVGGESTRPGAAVATSEDKGRAGETGQSKMPVSEAEELRRVLPVIEAIKHARPEAILSIDTYKAGVARAAVELGAEIVNDVSAFRWDPNMANTVAKLGCGAVLMHMRGRPDQWRHLEPVADIVGLVGKDLRQWADAALRAGVPQNKIVLDPGFGFGKNFEENYPLVAHFDELHKLGYPLLAGASRKSFVGRMLRQNGCDAPVEDRLFGTLANEVLLIMKGVHVIRTHEVKASRDVIRAADAVLAASFLSAPPTSSS